MNAPWTAYCSVAAGSALGGLARFGLSNWFTHRFGPGFPIGTLVVNVTGSLVIGVLAAWTAPGGRFAGISHVPWLFMAGLCGGYTTFSAFSLQTLELLQRGHWDHAVLNVLASVALCLGAVWLGYGLGRWSNG